MKKTLIALLVIMVSVCGTAMGQKPVKLGHINSSDLMQIMPGREEAQNTLQKEVDELQTTLKNMQNELEQRYNDYMGKKDQMSDLIRQTKERELQDMGQRIQEFQENAQKNIIVHNVSKTHHSYIIRDVFRYRGLIVGAPTYNTGLYHEMDVLLSELAGKDIKNHSLGWFGSFGWASKAVAEIQKWNDEKLHFEAIGEPVEIKQALTAETKAKCEALGKAMAEHLMK